MPQILRHASVQVPRPFPRRKEPHPQTDKYGWRSGFAGIPRIDSIFALRITPPGLLLSDVGISSHPLHEDLIAQCQQGRSDEHA